MMSVHHDSQTWRWMKIFALHHGDVLNESRIARCMGVSYHAVESKIAVFESSGFLRVLPAFRVNLKRRLVRSQKIFIRDIGLLHELLGMNRDTPLGRRILTGFMIERIISTMVIGNPESQFYYLGAYTGRHIDLLIDRSGNRSGVELHFSRMVNRRKGGLLEYALKQKIIRRGLILYRGEGCYMVSRDVVAMPYRIFLHEYGFWFDSEHSKYEVLENLRRHNDNKSVLVKPKEKM
jgi:predicted AAA+ superfamily ATPase